MAVPNMYPNGLPVDENSNLPDWMKAAIANVGQIGPGAASYLSSSGPQDFSKLQSIFGQSLGSAPSQLDESKIRSLFDEQVQAAMKLGSEQIRSAEAERGSNPGSGVSQQQARELGLKVTEPMVTALLDNLKGGLAFQQGSLGKLFESASGPQANSLGYRNTPQDINSQLPPYVQQSNPAAGGTTNNQQSFSSPGGSAKPGGGGAGGGGGTSGAPWWQTSYGEMNNGAGAAYNEKNPVSLAGWNPGGVAGGSSTPLNLSAGETPTGGGGHGLQNILDAGMAQSTPDPEEMGWISVAGPHESFYGTRASAEQNTKNGYQSTWSPLNY